MLKKINKILYKKFVANNPGKKLLTLLSPPPTGLFFLQVLHFLE